MSVTYTRQYHPVREEACASGKPMLSGIWCEMERALNNAHKYRHRPIMLWQHVWTDGLTIAPSDATEVFGFSCGPLYVPAGYTSLRWRAVAARTVGSNTLDLDIYHDARMYFGSPASSTWDTTYLLDPQVATMSVNSAKANFTATLTTVPCQGPNGSTRLGMQPGGGIVYPVVTYDPQAYSASDAYKLYAISVVAEP